ncbi:hypothetical protein [Halorhabdus salina]|uniref:hypothetical protein n=1 Tax=Halorhabdus salina TaxID=2750670 RepID=UPI0015EEB13D|nr:hypothetical protein [Halorhabdus salina]
MSADHESVPTDHDRQVGNHRKDRDPVRAGTDDGNAGEGVDRQATVVTAETDDRGGSPVESPSPVHQAVAAREFLWQSYRGSREDGVYIWMRTGAGDLGDTEKQL